MILSVDPNTNPKKVGWAIISLEHVYDWGIGYTANFKGYPCGKPKAIIAEDQYMNPQFGRKRMEQTAYEKNIFHLAHCAGRWMQIADDLHMQCHYVYPLDWMKAVAGRVLKSVKGRRVKEDQQLLEAAIYDRYPKLRDQGLTEHQLDAVAIGVYWLTKDFKHARR